MKKTRFTEKDFCLLDSDQKGFIHSRVQILYKKEGRIGVLRNYKRDDLVTLFAINVLNQIEEPILRRREEHEPRS